MTMLDAATTERRQEIASFLKESSIFQTLDVGILEGVSALFETVACGPGHVVFQEGDRGDSIYIIEKGAVEILKGGQPSRAIAYLTAGECFGEMSYLHGSARSAMVRVPEQAVLLRLANSSLRELTKKFPEVTSAIADVINKRTAGTLPFKPAALQGNLAFFDLPTVVQAAVSAGKDGVLLLFGRSAQALGQVSIRSGRIVRATFGQLKGESAIYELVSRDEPYEFLFEQRDLNSLQEDTALSKRIPAMLLVEGARRSDELKVLMKSVGWPNAVYLQEGKLPHWNALEPGQAAVAPKVWLLMEAGCTVEEIIEKLPADRYTILSVVDHVLKNGFASKDSSVRVQSQSLQKTMQLPKLALKAESKPQSRLRPQAEPIRLIQVPNQVVTSINAINSVTTSLGVLLGKNEVRFTLGQAVKKAAQRYPVLATLKISNENASLDLRSVSPDFSRDEEGLEALEHLTRTFIEIAAQVQKSQGSP